MIGDDPDPPIFEYGPWARMLLPPEAPRGPEIPKAQPFRYYSPRDIRWDLEPILGPGEVR